MSAGPVATGLPVASGRQTAREVWGLSRGYRLRLAGTGLLGTLSTGVDLSVPVAIGFLVDRVQEGTADLGTVLAATAVMALAAVVGAAGTALTIVLATRIYHAILATLREQLVGRAMTLPQHVVERAGTGDLISRSSDDVTAVADAAPAVIPVLTVTTFTIVVSLGGLAAIDWPYAAALAVVLPVHVLAMRWYLRVGPRVYLAERTAMSGRAQQILESQRGYATVLGFGLAEQRHQAVLSDSWRVAVQSVRARTVLSMLNGRLNLGELLSLSSVLVVGFVLIDRGYSTVGGATTAMLLVLRLLGPVNQLLMVVDTLQSALASLSRVVGVITVPVSSLPAALSTEDTGVRLADVSFRYDDGPVVLDHLTLAVAPGEHVAVVGVSGAGKTTLAGVVAGTHLPETGSVVRPERAAMITQEGHVFASSIRDNLTLAAPDAGDSDLRSALEAIGALDLVDHLPERLDTVVGVGGHLLTEAQAQKLALARLLLTDADLAILDEATAEAGSADAGQLDRAADAAMAGRTAIVVAHRLSQAAKCDRIVVMEHGQIIETGTHAELVDAGRVYAGLWAAWEGGRVVD